MSCFSKYEVEQYRNILYEEANNSKSIHLQSVVLTVDDAETIAEMLDEYANGNKCEEY